MKFPVSVKVMVEAMATMEVEGESQEAAEEAVRKEIEKEGFKCRHWSSDVDWDVMWSTAEDLEVVPSFPDSREMVLLFSTFVGRRNFIHELQEGYMDVDVKEGGGCTLRARVAEENVDEFLRLATGRCYYIEHVRGGE